MKLGLDMNVLSTNINCSGSTQLQVRAINETEDYLFEQFVALVF